MATHVLFELLQVVPSFQVKQFEEIGYQSIFAQVALNDLGKLDKMVQLVSCRSKTSHALENADDISEGVLHDFLKALLELNLSESKSSQKTKGVKLLGVSDLTLASIKSKIGIDCGVSERSRTIIRGIRQHGPNLLKGLQEGDWTKLFKRLQCWINWTRMFAMRVRQWYRYRFPELVKIVSDNNEYTRFALFIGDKGTLDESKLSKLQHLLENDATRADAAGKDLLVQPYLTSTESTLARSSPVLSH